MRKRVTPEIERAILEGLALRRTLTRKALARRHGISPHTVKDIIRRNRAEGRT